MCRQEPERGSEDGSGAREGEQVTEGARCAAERRAIRPARAPNHIVITGSNLTCQPVFNVHLTSEVTLSDGPHRSLRMRQGWRRVAEFADNRAFDSEDVREAVIAAFGDDLRADKVEVVAESVCEIVGGQQDSLFPTEKVLQLEALRHSAAGHVFGQMLIDCALHQLDNGNSGPNAAVEATAEAFSMWGARHARQTEEHYLRESTATRARDVRARIEQALGSVSYKSFARQFLSSSATSLPRSPPKLTGIDDGPRL